MREAVHGAEALGECERAFERAHHHLPARVFVVAVLHGALKPNADALSAVDTDGFGGRMHDRGQHCFDAVGHCIHAGRGGEAGREAECEVRIADGGFRHEEGRDERFFAAVIEDDDRAR